MYIRFRNHKVRLIYQRLICRQMHFCRFTTSQKFVCSRSISVFMGVKLVVNQETISLITKKHSFIFQTHLCTYLTIKVYWFYLSQIRTIMQRPVLNHINLIDLDLISIYYKMYLTEDVCSKLSLNLSCSVVLQCENLRNEEIPFHWNSVHLLNSYHTGIRNNSRLHLKKYQFHTS